MRLFTTAILAGALMAAPIATVANAQSGYDTGAGKSTGTTTNSGAARPDATSNSGGADASRPTEAAPTSGSGGSGSGMKRPDADSNAGKTGGVEQPATTKAAPTDTKN